MKRCTKCILPDNYPNISFNTKGVCNICDSFERRWSNYDWVEKKKELEKILNKAKAKKRRYDCLVPVSGGKDSAYALYICTKVYKMKVLAVNFNNGFVSSVASQNLSRLAKHFDADYISWGPKWSTLKQAYRTFFLKTGDFCAPCSRAITAYTYRLAFRERIPLIVLGFNPKTDNNPVELEIIDQRLFKDVMGNVISNREKKDFLVFEPIRFLIKRIDLPSYIPYIENDLTSVLDDALGEQGGFSGQMHFDCMVSPVANWLRRRKWGFGKKTQKYSAFIRDGQMTRENALEQAEGLGADDEPENLNYFMEMLELTKDDIERAKELSALNFKHYNPKLIKVVGTLTGIIDKDYK
ncbi:MAG: N-acetyl sugar amidotransferase [Thermodesulfobacteriota bacterium]|nr:N-acetyl sugar amidotransferase [Thermodesulfobacteriota bacterium]